MQNRALVLGQRTAFLLSTTLVVEPGHWLRVGCPTPTNDKAHSCFERSAPLHHRAHDPWRLVFSSFHARLKACSTRKRSMLTLKQL